MPPGHAKKQAPIKHNFGGHFESNGGPQLMGNIIGTSGGPINIGVNFDEKLPAKICELPNFLLSPYFTGRGDELQQIERVFSSSSGDLPQRYIIHGMPGIGKTQLALKFATLAFQNGQYPYVFWVSAVSVDKLTQDVSKVVDLLRLPGRHTQNQASRLTAARAWLEDSTVAKSWLVILDNVSEETAITILRDFCPQYNCGGRILITTRTAAIAERYTTSAWLPQSALRTLPIDDAVAMLSAGAKLEREGRMEASYTDLERLVRSVGNLPLAIDQAASYIRETGSSPQEVLDVYISNEAPDILSWENDLSRHEEKSVVATFTPALNKIQQTAPDAVTLLRVLCFCDPEGIPMSILTQGCNALYQDSRYSLTNERAVDSLRSIEGLQNSLRRVSSVLPQRNQNNTVNVQTGGKHEAVRGLFLSPLRLSKAIQEVQRLSLAAQASEDTDRIIRIHDLVHFLLRRKLMVHTEQVQWLEIAIEVVCKAFEGIGDCESPQNWSQYSRFISHIESLEKFATQYTLESKELLVASTWAAVYLDVCGLYDRAAASNERTLKQKERILGKKHPDTLISMNNLASALSSQGKYKEAERINRQTLALHETVLGKKHPDTLRSMSNLATALSSQGKYKEAERIHRQTLALDEKVLGKKHPATLANIGNLAIALSRQGKYEEAERIHRQTLALRETVLGKKHPETLISKHNLATTLLNQGKYKEAERIYRQTLALRETVLGKKHPNTLISKHNLAVALSKQGKYEKAERIYRETLALDNTVLRKKHPDTLATMNNLALMLDDQGRYEEAEQMYRQTLALRETVLGKKHPDTLRSAWCLACLLHKNKRFKDAEPLYDRAYTGFKETLGDSHPDSIACLQHYSLMREEENSNR